MTHKKQLKRLDRKLDRLKRSPRKRDRRKYHAIEAELRRIAR